jgi:hypothetical protein
MANKALGLPTSGLYPVIAYMKNPETGRKLFIGNAGLEVLPGRDGISTLVLKPLVPEQMELPMAHLMRDGLDIFVNEPKAVKPEPMRLVAKVSGYLHVVEGYELKPKSLSIHFDD